MEGVRCESRHERGIALELMLHPEVHDLWDEWCGVTNPAARRKLQNRLNQRAYRQYTWPYLVWMYPADTPAGRRRSAQKQEMMHERFMLLMRIDEDTAAPYINELPQLVAANVDVHRDSDEWRSRHSASDTPTRLYHSLESLKPTKQRYVEQGNTTKATRAPARTMAELWRQWVDEAHNLSTPNVDPKVLEIVHQRMIWSPQKTGKSSCSQMVRFEELLTALIGSKGLYPLSFDHLLSLIHYNVFRALVSNMRLLNLDLERMESKDYQSPFLDLDSKTCSIDVDSLPPDFQPTLIQRTVPHHPLMDVFPDPVVRDNIILDQSRFDDYTFGMAVLGHDTWHESDPSQRGGMVVWAEPWKIKSWEITDGFFARWQWLLKGADKLEGATNSWREKRGLSPLAFERRNSFSMIKPGCMGVPRKGYTKPGVLPC